MDTEDLVNDYYPSVEFVSWGPTSLRERIVDFRSDITNKVSRLESILERLELIPESPTLQLNQQSSQSTLSTDTNLKQRIQLFQTLCEHFNESDLKTLCFHLGVDYDALPDVGKNNKTRELIVLLERQKRIQELLEEGKKVRPNSEWNL